MKLLQHTARYFGWFTLLSLPLSVGLLYFTLRYVVNREEDELLAENAATLVRQWTANGIPADTVLALTDDLIEVRRLPDTDQSSILPSFGDTLLWNPDEGESEPARQYRFAPHVGEHRYAVKLTHSILDRENLLFSALLSLIILVALLLAAVWWFSRFTARQLWQPFHDTLSALSGFDFSSKEPLQLPDTPVQEFTDLNRAANTMTRRITDDYLAVRHFTGNAAHELQNPLAIIQSKAELLLQNEQLDEKTLSAIADIHRTAHRLSRLNRALLFLHRIENRQFPQREVLNFKQLVVEKWAQLEERAAARAIQCQFNLQETSIPIHPELAEALVGNLLGNAVKHNLPDGGQLHITLSPVCLRLQNTGLPLQISPDTLFERFKKADPTSSDSPGLGLAIVQEICRLYGFGLTYSVQGDWHSLTVAFNYRETFEEVTSSKTKHQK